MLKGKSLQAVQAVGKTLELLEVLVTGRERLTIRELADKLCLSRRELLLMLISLETREMVRWDDASRIYRPGRAAIELARKLHSQRSVAAQAPASPATGRAAKTRTSTRVRSPRPDRRMPVSAAS